MANLTQSDLDQFTCTEQHFKHFTGLLYTDGIRYLAENAGAYWLIDVIGSYQRQLNKTVRLAEFQLWKLEVVESRGLLTCRSDSNEKPVVSQEIEFTDFCLESIKLYVENGCLLLPSEH